MYKNALKEDLIRVVEDLDGTVESTDTIAKLKTKIEKSSTFESDPDFVKTLIKNCIDERVSRNERDLEKQKIELAKLQLAQLEKEIELQTAKNKALSLNPAAKVEEKQFETNIENMIKSIKTLSLPVPTRSENFNLFFQSLERAFLTKKINDEYKSEILINLLGERAHNVLLYIKKDELNDYEKLKSIVLREFQRARRLSRSEKLQVNDQIDDWLQQGIIKESVFDYCSPMKSKHRRFAILRKIFEPWQWKRRKKRDRFEQTSRTLERKISMRSTKDQLIKKGVLMPDGTDKDQDSKINDSVHSTVLSSSQNHAMPVKHNVFPVEPSGCRRVLVCSVFFVCFRFSSGLDEKGIRTAADSLQSGWPVVASRKANRQQTMQSSRAGAANPPDPHQDSPKFLLSEDMKLNLFHIGSLAHNGISQVRIHWMLDLVQMRFLPDFEIVYDFNYLDQLVHMLWKNGLRPGFELMGNPSGYFTDFENETQVYMWEDLIYRLASHYIAKLVLSRCACAVLTFDTVPPEMLNSWDVSVTLAPARQTPIIWPL
ncbi:alpha-L-iduronidase [Trichonephila clavipes]|nr:alpha-L-iduronidase [Trichonephila clavipes]